jgi:hypothetical protein
VIVMQAPPRPRCLGIVHAAFWAASHITLHASQFENIRSTTDHLPHVSRASSGSVMPEAHHRSSRIHITLHQLLLYPSHLGEGGAWVLGESAPLSMKRQVHNRSPSAVVS